MRGSFRFIRDKDLCAKFGSLCTAARLAVDKLPNFAIFRDFRGSKKPMDRTPPRGCETVLGCLCASFICSTKRADFRQWIQRLRKTVSFEQQMMSAHGYSTECSTQFCRARSRGRLARSFVSTTPPYSKTFYYCTKTYFSNKRNIFLAIYFATARHIKYLTFIHRSGGK